MEVNASSWPQGSNHSLRIHTGVTLADISVFRRGYAEVFGWRLVGQRSNRMLVLVHVRGNAGRYWLYLNTTLADMWKFRIKLLSHDALSATSASSDVGALPL